MNPAHELSPHAMRIVAAHSALAGLCPLIPVPFVDDLLIGSLRERMLRALFAAHDLQLPRGGAKVLTTSPPGWLPGAAAAVLLFPIKKLVRKLVYVLAVKDCADVAASVFHDGWLVARLLARPSGLALTDRNTLERARAAMLRTYADVDPTPLRRALAGALLAARAGAVQAIQRLWQAKPREDEPVVEAMRAAAMSQWDYLDALDRKFREQLGVAAEEVEEVPALSG